MALVQTLAEMPQPVETGGAETRKSMRRLAELMSKQGIDASPVQHWTQGLSRVTNAMMGGYLDNMADKQAKAEEAKTVETLRKALGLGAETEVPAQAAPSAQTPAGFAPPAFPQGTRPPVSVNADAETPAATPQAYINRAFGSTPQDREIATRTVLGEASNQGQQGMNAVADVIRNRAVAGGYGGDTIGQVSQARNQFEPWNTPQGRARMAGVSPDSPQYAAAQNAVDSAGIGTRPDVSGGAHYFYAPKAQAQLAQTDGRPVVPSFAAGREPTAVVGAHNFYGPTTRTAQAGGVPQGVPQGAPGVAPSAPPQGQPQAPQQASQTGQMNPRVRNTIDALISNPQTRAIGLQLWAQHSKPNNPTWGVIGEDEYGKKEYGWINPSNQSITRLPSAQGGQQGAPSVIPPPPPGVDPKAWRAEMTKRAAGEPIPAEAAGRLAMMDTAAKGMPQARAVFGREWGKGDFAKSAAARAGVGALAGDVGEARRTVRTAIESALRVMTGAAAPISEVKQYEDMFMPNEFDDPKSAKQKLDNLESFMTNARTNVMQGRTLPGSQPQAPQAAPPAAPQSAPQQQRSIGGKNYVKINGRWFEQ